jgi:hypothetical protein
MRARHAAVALRWCLEHDGCLYRVQEHVNTAGEVLRAGRRRARVQVKRAQAHLLEQLYAHLSTLSGGDTESLLEEDPEVSHRRARAKQARRCPGPAARKRG